MARFFTSDLHFSHANVIEYCNRPFASVAEMNQAIIDRWNAVVSADDMVFVLGDVALGKINESLPLVGQLNGHKFLIPGNHDRCWTGHKKVGTWEQRYLDAGFEHVLPNQITEVIGSTTVLLCHFPYEGDSHDTDRYSEHRPKDQGQWLIHGHVHEAWKTKGRMVNCGVDVWDFAPVPESEISRIIDNKKG